MKKTSFRFVITLVTVLLLASCGSRKDIIYLNDLENIKNSTVGTIIDSINFSPPVYKVDDRLTINISSINTEASKPYNLPSASFNIGNASSIGQQQQQSYLIDKNGDINFPRLGKINVIGKSRVELEAYLEKKIKPFLSDVKANVQLVNFRISVLGEVSKPGQYSIDRDKMSILQGIGLAGDLTIHGKRQDIKLIREKNGEIKYYNLDLTSEEIVKSPAYYLQQNDVVYVAPNKPKVNASASSPANSIIISVTGLLITIISLLLR